MRAFAARLIAGVGQSVAQSNLVRALISYVRRIAAYWGPGGRREEIVSESGEAIEWLCQRDIRKRIDNGLVANSWIPLYGDIPETNGTFFCALIPSEHVSEVLKSPYWDLTIGSGMPGCTMDCQPPEPEIKYARFTTDHGIEPLVIRRYFDGLKPEHSEILEEFRLFHNLFYDQNADEYQRIDEAGNVITVVRTQGGILMASVREIRQFLSIKEMHLAIYFESRRHSPVPLDSVPVAERSVSCHEPLHTYALFVDSDVAFVGGSTTFSLLVGKQLIPPLAKEDSGVWPYGETEAEAFESFIIAIDDDGNSVSHSCDPDMLANYFGKNSEAPHYLTPVFFDREVLRKYYDKHEKYSVDDGRIRCGGLWGMRIDNNRADYVVAYLGDLGRDLPASERLYWKSYNVFPDGEVSKVEYQRGYLAEPTEPDGLDLIFKYRFSQFQSAWKDEFDWHFFRPLNEKDEHEFATLRIPLSDEQAEFDDQVLALTKLLVDSLNEGKIAQGISSLPEGARGIDKLEAFLRENEFPDVENVVPFLRNLQALRSTGVAHRKGSKYEKATSRLGIGKQSLRSVFSDLLISGSGLLESLGAHFLQQPPTE